LNERYFYPFLKIRKAYIYYKMVEAIKVEVVVPSPAKELVLAEALLTKEAPISFILSLFL
jgi:hypothetical protein